MDKFYPNSFEDSVQSAFDKADNELPASGNWDEMQQLLDKEMPVGKKKRRFFFWFFIAAILLGGYWTFQLWKNDLHVKNVEVSLEKNPVQNLKASQNSTERQNSTESPTSLDSQNPIENSLPAEKKNPIEAQIKKNEAAIEKSTISKKTQEEIKADIVNDKENRGDIEPKLTASNSNCEAVKPVLSDSTLSISDSVVKSVNPLLRQHTRWQWNLSFAPDFLLANLQPFNRPGVSIGMGINYQLSTNWAIRTGFLYNYTPVYESGQTYLYKPSPNLPAYNTLELKQVKGSLHIFEVPLAIRYTAKPEKKISFLGSVGLSSLFFVKQKLTYDLLLNGNTPLSWNSENDSDDFGESHILSNLVVGTGISVKTKRNAVIEIEPVFKLPLEELGEGHNKLGTIAIYLHLKQPIFRQKK